MRSIRTAFSLMADFASFIFLGGVQSARRKGAKIGKDCRILTRNFGSEPFLISIGDRTTITSGVRILTHDGSTSLVRNPNGRRYLRYAPVSIGSDVFIGANAIIMPGVTVHSWCVIGAGSVVIHDVPEGTVVAGNPARAIKSFDDFDRGIRATCPNDEDLDNTVNYEARVTQAIKILSQRTL